MGAAIIRWPGRTAPRSSSGAQGNALFSESAVPVSGRHMQPLSERIVADLESPNMAKGAPILLRIFKEESELEVWKIDGTACPINDRASQKCYPCLRNKP
jgi:hypothetical protein